MTTNVNLGFVAAAGGSVDAITATYAPAPTALVDKMLLWFRATGANTSTTPTFSPNNLTARTIVKNGGQALVAGDIPAAGAIVGLVYDLANTRWEIIGKALSVPSQSGNVLFSGPGFILDSDSLFTFNKSTNTLDVQPLSSASTGGIIRASDITSTHALSAKDITATGVIIASNSSIKFTGLSAYDDDAAAGLGGLTTGALYQTTGSGAAPLNVAGILMVKQ